MKEQNEEKNLEIGGVIAKTEKYIEQNKKTIITIGGAVVVVALAIWAFFGLYANPRQQRAAEEMFAAEQWFNAGDFEQALNGNDQYLGFEAIIDQYGCTKSGNLAKYYAGVCQLNLGKFAEAEKMLKSYKGKDAFTAGEALMLIGDACAEQDKAADACSYYEKAAKKSDNMIVAPVALWKAGMMQLKLGNNEAAVNFFQQIKDKYPVSAQSTEADKYISYAQNKK